MYPSRKNFLLQKFDEATERPFGYLLMDLKPTTPDETLVSGFYSGRELVGATHGRRQILR
jgi:hypothetical protein